MRESLIREKVPPPPDLRPKRKLKCVVKCGKECSACPYLIEGRNIKIDKQSTWKMNIKMSCFTFNSVYLIECQKHNCMQRYRVKDRLEIGLPITGATLSINILTKPLGHTSTFQGTPWPTWDLQYWNKWREIVHYIEKKEKNTWYTNSTHTTID